MAATPQLIQAQVHCQNGDPLHHDSQLDEKQIQHCNENDPFLVEFAEPTDPGNPKDWSLRRKWIVTTVLSVTGLNRIMVSTIMAPALLIIGQQLSMGPTEAVMSMSVYLLATAFGPLLIGPLSEVYGRKPLLHATNVWFLVWNILCGFATSKGLLISARLFAGLGASAIYALGGGVLADVWRPEQRGTSLGIYLLIPLLGAALGPILGGIITQYSTWRWMFWSTSIVQAAMIVLAFRFFHETHAPTILHARAAALRASTQDERYTTTWERLESHLSALGALRQSLTRPYRLMLRHRIVQVQALISAFSYGLLYIMLSTFSDLWTSRYDDTILTSGLHYISLCAGEVVGAQLGGWAMDAIFTAQKRKAGGSSTPEFRIPLMLPGACLVPVGLLWYGWAAEQRVFWLAVDLGAFVTCFASQTSGMALTAYVLDSYPDHASSATAATQFFRSICAFAFPLFAPTMYARLGYGVGNTLLAALTLGIGVPLPLALWYYGPRLRAKEISSY